MIARPSLARAVGALALAAGVVAAGALRARATALRPPPIETRFDVPPFPAEIARPFSFGFRAFGADVAFIQAIQVHGGRKTSSNYAEGLPEDRQLARLLTYATDLDPEFRGAYRFAGNSLLRHTLDGKAAGVLAAELLLAKGVRHRPDDWRIWFSLGFVRGFYLNDNEGAAQAMRAAARLPGSPSYLPLLATRLAANADDLRAAEAMAHEMLAQATEEATREEWSARLVELQAEGRARLIDRAAAQFKRRTGALPRSPEELVRAGDLREVPPEPRGGTWTIDAAGLARSDRTRRLRLTAKGNIMGLEVQ